MWTQAAVSRWVVCAAAKPRLRKPQLIQRPPRRCTRFGVTGCVPRRDRRPLACWRRAASTPATEAAVLSLPALPRMRRVLSSDRLLGERLAQLDNRIAVARRSRVGRDVERFGDLRKRQLAPNLQH